MAIKGNRESSLGKVLIFSLKKKSFTISKDDWVIMALGAKEEWKMFGKNT